MPARFVRKLGEMVELVEEILIRLPPDEPGHLLRASLVCKPWLRLLSGQGFRRRYGEFHRTPPMLGFLHRTPGTCAEFVPTTDFLARGPDIKHQYSVLDCRHGRVLLSSVDEDENQSILVVWDPMKGSKIELCYPEDSGTRRWWRASVLCAAGSCSHGDCHSGPFLVVFVNLDEVERVATAYTYSSETSSWSSPALTDVHPSLGYGNGIGFFGWRSVLAGDALYFLILRDHDQENDANEYSILKYDVGKASLSEILLSEQDVERVRKNPPILMVAEDGRLGIAHLDSYCLCVWWMVEVDPDGVASWMQQRDIILKTDHFPIGDFYIPPDLLGCVEGTDIIFAISRLGTYMIDVKSQSSKMLTSKLYQHPNVTRTFTLYPYVSFYYPPAVAGVGAEASSEEAGHGNEEA